MDTHHEANQTPAKCYTTFLQRRRTSERVLLWRARGGNLLPPSSSFFDFSPSLSDTCEIGVFQLVCECCDICYYAFQRVVFGDLFAGLENEFNITGLEGVGFIISITAALSDTKLSFKHPNDTLKFNEILSPANI